MTRRERKPLATVGWREWLELPELGGAWVRAKIDTGARTSALHAYDVEVDEATRRVRFKFHPLQDDNRTTALGEAAFAGYRKVRSSNGEQERRPVIRTEIRLADRTFETEITLTRRDAMGFRMLVGRSSLKRRFQVDVSRSFVSARPPQPLRD